VQTAAHVAVRGPGFRFEAPAAWSATTIRSEAVARRDAAGSTLISATSFTLLKEYSPKFFARAAKELDRVAATLASQAHGTLIESTTVTVDGVQIRAYRLRVRPKSGPSYDERIGFVLQGKREYQLLCRAPVGAGDPDGACALLYSSFTMS
jgi:hypothetical protein